MTEYAPYVGLVGLGYWGKNILRNLFEMGVLAFACDASWPLLKERQKEYPTVSFTHDYEVVLKDPNIRAVMIAVPAAMHARFALRALEAGKDVFVEKPLALTVSEGEALVACAQKHGRLLMV